MVHLPRSHGQSRKLAALLAICACSGLGAERVTAPHARVVSVKFWSFDDLTRISIETSGDFDLKYDRLDHPDRLFFDLVGAVSEVGPRGFRTFSVGDKIVRQIRVAETQRGVTRVVLDLNRFARFTTSRLENPDRLLIDVRDSDAMPIFGGPDPPLLANTPRRFIPPSGPAAKLRGVSLVDSPPHIDSPVPAPLRIQAKLAPAPAPYGRSARLPSPPPERQRGAEGIPEPARGGPSEQSMTRVLGLKIHRVVIDAGHGGHDTGTIGAGGLLEKDLVLDVALRLGKLIQQRLGAEVIYTRSGDTFIPLQDRTRIANESHADLFLSIHANSSPDRSASGVETYYLNFTSSKSALDVAMRENAGSDKSVFELKDLLQKIALQDKIEESREFAACLQASLYAASTRLDSRSKDRGVRKAPFVVLIGASMPSILAEIGFISNPRDANALRRGEGRQRIAEALYKGVAKYSATLSHFENVARRGTD